MTVHLFGLAYAAKTGSYAVGHLGKVQVGSQKFAGFDEDFATVNPYLGTDGIKPFIDVCKEENW